MRCESIVCGQRGNNFTLILGVSTAGIVHSEFFRGGTNADRFNAWMEAASAAAGRERTIFIMDNAPYHRRAAHANLQPGHEIQMLPPYSPFLNIAENAFSSWKARGKRQLAFKRQLADVREHLFHQPAEVRSATLLQLATQNLAAITPNKMVRSTRRMGRLMPRLLHQEDISQNHA